MDSIDITKADSWSGKTFPSRLSRFIGNGGIKPSDGFVSDLKNAKDPFEAVDALFRHSQETIRLSPMTILFITKGILDHEDGGRNAYLNMLFSHENGSVSAKFTSAVNRFATAVSRYLYPSAVMENAKSFIAAIEKTLPELAKAAELVNGPEPKRDSVNVAVAPTP